MQNPLLWLRRKTHFCVWVCTRGYGKLNIEFTISSFCSLYSDQKYVLKVRGKLNNVVILVTWFWSKMDLAPFGIKLLIYWYRNIWNNRCFLNTSIGVWIHRPFISASYVSQNLGGNPALYFTRHIFMKTIIKISYVEQGNWSNPSLRIFMKKFAALNLCYFLSSALLKYTQHQICSNTFTAFSCCWVNVSQLLNY